jgi:hypothetical protein
VDVIVVRNGALIREAEEAIIAYFVKKGETGVLDRIKSRNNKIFYDAPVSFWAVSPGWTSPSARILRTQIALTFISA